MKQNVAALVELRARQERLMAEAMQLQQDMVDFDAATREQAAALLARTPLDLRPRRTKVSIGRFVTQQQRERWRAERKLVSESKYTATSL